MATGQSACQRRAAPGSVFRNPKGDVRYFFLLSVAVRFSPVVQGDFLPPGRCIAKYRRPAKPFHDAQKAVSVSAALSQIAVLYSLKVLFQ